MVKIQNGLYVNPDKVNSVFIIDDYFDDCVAIKIVVDNDDYMLFYKTKEEAEKELEKIVRKIKNIKILSDDEVQEIIKEITETFKNKFLNMEEKS